LASRLYKEPISFLPRPCCPSADTAARTTDYGIICGKFQPFCLCPGIFWSFFGVLLGEGDAARLGEEKGERFPDANRKSPAAVASPE
jgi:hypothetical protein